MNVNKAGRNSKLHYLLSGMSRGSPAAKYVSRVCCRSRGNRYISQPDGIKDKLISTRKLTWPKTDTRKQIPEESESSRVILTTQTTDWCIKINMVASTHTLYCAYMFHFLLFLILIFIQRKIQIFQQKQNPAHCCASRKN